MASTKSHNKPSISRMNRKDSLVSTIHKLSFFNFPHIHHPSHRPSRETVLSSESKIKAGNDRHPFLLPLQSESDTPLSPQEVIQQFFFTWFPITKQLSEYSILNAWSDLGAGLTIAFVLIPQSIAYASLARLSPIHALISAVFPVIVYSLLGSSRHLAIGPEALSSVLVGVTIDQFLTDNTAENKIDPVEIAATLTLMVGIFSILLGTFQAGFIQNILSGYLLTGFVLGVAMLIMSEQLIELFGLDPATIRLHGDLSTFEKIRKCVQGFYTWTPATTFVGLGSFAFLLLVKGLKVYLKQKKHVKLTLVPDILILVVIVTSLSYCFDFKSKGVRTLGLFDHKLVPPILPQLNVPNLSRLAGSTLLIIMVGFLESQTVTRTFGMKCGYFPSPDQELFALGMSNVVGALVGGYVTFGSLPRSRIQFTAGGKTMMTGIFAAIFVLMAFSFASGILQYLPRATLAAIVFNAAINLIEYHEIYFLFKMRNWREIGMFLATWTTTTFLEMGLGIILSFTLAVLLIVKKSTFVDLVLVGELPPQDQSGQINGVTNQEVPLKTLTTTMANGSSCTIIEESPPEMTRQASSSSGNVQFVNVAEYPHAILRDGILSVMVRGPLYFYNAGRIRRDIEHLMLQDIHSPAKDIPDDESSALDANASTSSLSTPQSQRDISVVTLIPNSNSTDDENKADEIVIESMTDISNSLPTKKRMSFSSDKKRNKSNDKHRLHKRALSFAAFESDRSPQISFTGAAPANTAEYQTVSRNPDTAPVILEIPSSRSATLPNATSTTLGNSHLHQVISSKEPVQRQCDGRFVLILDFEQCTQMDSAAVLILTRIVKNFHHSDHPRGDIRVIFSGVHLDRHLVLFKKSGLVDALGEDGIFSSLQEAVHDVELSRRGIKRKCD